METRLKEGLLQSLDQVKSLIDGLKAEVPTPEDRVTVAAVKDMLKAVFAVGWDHPGFRNVSLPGFKGAMRKSGYQYGQLPDLRPGTRIFHPVGWGQLMLGFSSIKRFYPALQLVEVGDDVVSSGEGNLAQRWLKPLGRQYFVYLPGMDFAHTPDSHQKLAAMAVLLAEGKLTLAWNIDGPTQKFPAYFSYTELGGISRTDS